MSIDPDKIREKAQKLLSRKKARQAIDLYATSLARDGSHPDLWCELASLQKSTGDAPASSAAYFRAAELYVKSGQDRHGLAACQKALQAGADTEDTQAARRLLKVLAARIKTEKSGRRPSQPEVGAAAKSLLKQAAGSGRVHLGEPTLIRESDYADLDVTPLPTPLSPLLPMQKRQASDFEREPTYELDLDKFAVTAQEDADTQPPPPPISYWEAQEGGETKPRRRSGHPVRRGSALAPKERFMVLSRRDPGTLLAGLRTGRSYGIPETELERLEQQATSPDDLTFRVLAQSLLFEGVPREQLLVHASPDRLVTFSPGEILARTGRGSDMLYSLVRGRVRALSTGDPPEELSTLRPGAIVGEQSFVGTAGMKTLVQATEEVEAISLTREQANELLTEHPASLYAMLRVVEERVVDNMLQRAGFFRLFEPAERDAICPRFEILEVADDEIIVEQGTPSKTLCLLMSGAIELSHASTDERAVKMLIDPGGVFGEESLIDGRPQIFTARTTARSWIMLLRREEYLKIYEKHPVLVRALKDVLRRRRKTLDQVNRGDVSLEAARWPDFNPESVQSKQVKPIIDRGKKKRRASSKSNTPSEGSRKNK